MTNTPNPEVDMQSILTNAGARTCGKCGQLASLPAHGERQTWFCFECGNEEKQPSTELVPHTPE